MFQTKIVFSLNPISQCGCNCSYVSAHFALCISLIRATGSTITNFDSSTCVIEFLPTRCTRDPWRETVVVTCFISMKEKKNTLILFVQTEMNSCILCLLNSVIYFSPTAEHSCNQTITMTAKNLLTWLMILR